MKRNISKALAILMTLALIMSLAAVSAFAVNGGQKSFEKELAMPSTANVPKLEFVFTIDPGDPVPVGADNEIEIKAGIGNPTIEHAVFPSDDDDPAAVAADPDDATKKIAVDNVFVDFSGIDFTAPGVYRYVVTEQASGVDYITNDQNATRYLDVFVFYQDTDNDSSTPDELVVTGYSLTNTTSNFEKFFNETTQLWEYRYVEEGNRTKTSGYKNELKTVNLEFTKAIEGNQADMTKRFEYTLELSGLIPNSTYTLEFTGTAADIIGTNDTVAANGGEYTITADSDGAYTGKFYLTNADVVKVLDLPVGYTYSVDEVAEDYESEGASVTGYTDPTTGQNVTSDQKTSYTNTREGIIPTGVILTVAPFMIGLLLFGAVMMFMISRRRRATY